MFAGKIIKAQLGFSCRSSRFRCLLNGVPRVATACQSMLAVGSKLKGESGRTYRLICPLLPQTSQGAAALWSAVDDADDSKQVVVKEPSENDHSVGWPLFQHEYDMQLLFCNSKFMRQMVDYIPPRDGAKPKIVLEAFEKTLWTARCQRPMTSSEIKWIMKAIILAIWEIHRQGLVYSDLKMENVVVNGFRSDGAGNIRSIIARLADCGSITSPSNREIISIAYRSPEVYFGKQWTMSTDIWSWGIMYCHLFEAQANFSNPGLYDSICKGSLQDKTQAVRAAMAIDFDLRSIAYYAEDEQSRSLLPLQNELGVGHEKWNEKLSRKGIKTEDIVFLSQILNPEPTERWRAQDIICCGYLESPA